MSNISHKVVYERNDDDQISAIRLIPSGGGSTQTLASYEYDPAGRLTRRTLQNGVETDYTLGALDNVTAIVVPKGAQLLWSNVYTTGAWEGSGKTTAGCSKGERSGSDRVNRESIDRLR